MPPKRSVVPASKQMIEDSFRGTSTRRAYDTYQQQFEAFLHAHKAGTALEAASTEDCTDFFQVLYTRGLTARTIDVAKSAFVAYFKSKRVSPNPAQDSISRQYIVGLQKFNKKNNVDEEKKAHPLTVHELSTLMNGLSGLHPFVGSLLRLLLPVAFLGCYRISEVLNLRRKDVQLVSDGSGRYLSVRLRNIVRYTTSSTRRHTLACVCAPSTTSTWQPCERPVRTSPAVPLCSRTSQSSKVVSRVWTGIGPWNSRRSGS
ncbi:hypothetical protein H257_05135 [Aphanomyces astaci]|uniref:Core-binding (CB) domain-containing protein n=1 Tax=Aphanomyces astaci TaxID=112090 RepID=W4GS58_APHAT|nr:hypothetical protein H257_05135 [Aphanomyces astaci]ETV82532.1 hypothetical protein H257_05135 [Aphanomyces astaci]|eukprot:XP_009828201.1 hypothetical protein H257_05135 [Aphanomyces astaci]